MEIRDLIDSIDSLKAEVDSLRPLDPEIEARVMQKFRLDWNYHSSNIEGNSLTYGETKTFLLHGLTAAGKPLRDHLEIKGHNEAVQELQDIVRKQQPLTEQIIRGFHQLLLGPDPYWVEAQTPDGGETSREIHPGRYKQEPNHVRTVTGETFYFASPEDTPAEMKELIEWYRNVEDAGDTHPLLLAALLHYQFVRIHPFDDGNGRMARMVMNLVLMRAGYPPVIIPTEEREEYFRALRQADGGEQDYFVEYIGEQVLRSLTIYLKGARGEEIEERDDLDKKIALFKASLENHEEQDREDSGQIERSAEAIEEVVEKSIIPLVQELHAKLEQFDELFADKQFKFGPMGYSVSQPSYEVLLEQIRTINRLIKPDMRGIHFQWFQYKKKIAKSFDMDTVIWIATRRYEYAIRWNKWESSKESSSRQELLKPYSQFLTEEERNRIVKDIVERVIQMIEKRTE